jgi:hypothetical protein
VFFSCVLPPLPPLPPLVPLVPAVAREKRSRDAAAATFFSPAAATPSTICSTCLYLPSDWRFASCALQRA